jgi:dihydrofolate reductase
MIQEPTCVGLSDEFRGTARSRGEQTRKETPVSATVLDMSMSLDGFIAGPNAGPGNGLGDGGQRLHDWALTRADSGEMEVVRTGINGQVFAELMSTGAVVAGRGTFEPAGGWGGDHHDSVPIFILYRQGPGIDISHWPLVTPVNDIATAMAEAKEAAGVRNVLVHGTGIARLALAAGVLDELELHVIPVLLGQGRRLFEGLPPEQIELHRTRILDGEAGVTHMHYQVQY